MNQLEKRIEDGYRIDKDAVLNNLKELHPEYIRRKKKKIFKGNAVNLGGIKGRR